MFRDIIPLRVMLIVITTGLLVIKPASGVEIEILEENKQNNISIQQHLNDIELQKSIINTENTKNIINDKKRELENINQYNCIQINENKNLKIKNITIQDSKNNKNLFLSEKNKLLNLGYLKRRLEQTKRLNIGNKFNIVDNKNQELGFFDIKLGHNCTENKPMEISQVNNFLNFDDILNTNNNITHHYGGKYPKILYTGYNILPLNYLVYINDHTNNTTLMMKLIIHKCVDNFEFKRDGIIKNNNENNFFTCYNNKYIFKRSNSNFYISYVLSHFSRSIFFNKAKLIPNQFVSNNLIDKIYNKF